MAALARGERGTGSSPATVSTPWSPRHLDLRCASRQQAAARRGGEQRPSEAPERDSVDQKSGGYFSGRSPFSHPVVLSLRKD